MEYSDLVSYFEFVYLEEYLEKKRMDIRLLQLTSNV